MQPAFQKFVDIIRQRVISKFNKHGEIMPTWYLQQDNEDISEVPTPFSGTLEKGLVDIAMRITIQEDNIQRYVYVCESWVAPVTGGPEDKLAPSDRPDRKEILIFVAEDKSGEAATAFCDILRLPGSELAMIKEIVIDPEIHAEAGRFSNMFGNHKKQTQH